MPDERPSGSAPFIYALRLLQFFDSRRLLPFSGKGVKEPPFSLATQKRDGFKVIIDIQPGKNAKLYTKNGHEYDTTASTKFGAMGRIMHEKFASLLKTPIIYKKDGKEHKVSTIYAEAVWDKDDGHGDNLQALMHASKDTVQITDLCAFDCKFEDEGFDLPLADKLELIRKQVGPQYAVRTLIDTRNTITQADMYNFTRCLQTEEGVVLVTADNKKIKHKTVLPVPLLLVAVGLTKFGTVDVPTHFVWALRSAGEYRVVLIDNKAYLFEEKRASEKKLSLKANQIRYDRTTKLFRCTDTTFMGANYNGLLAMAQNLNAPTRIQKYSARANGKNFTIGENRKENFNSTKFQFLQTPKLGVVGANRLWTLKNAAGIDPTHVEVHLQAPQFLASSEYGADIYRDLVYGDSIPITYGKLVELASIPRNCRLHAQALYGEYVDLVFGKYDDKRLSDDEAEDTPQQSDDESEEMFRKRKFVYDTACTSKRVCTLSAM